MDAAPHPADNPAMTETEADDLFAEAVQLAHDTFTDATDEHVTGVFARLAWNRRRGLGDEGVVTVH